MPILDGMLGLLEQAAAEGRSVQPVTSIAIVGPTGRQRNWDRACVVCRHHARGLCADNQGVSEAGV